MKFLLRILTPKPRPMNELIICLVLGYNINLLMTNLAHRESMLVTAFSHFYTTVFFTTMLNCGLLSWQHLHGDDNSFREPICKHHSLDSSHSSALNLPGSFPEAIMSQGGPEEYRLPRLPGSFPTDNDNNFQANNGSNHTSSEGISIAMQQTVELSRPSFPHPVNFNLLLHDIRSLMNALTHKAQGLAVRHSAKVRFHSSIVMVKECAGCLLSLAYGRYKLAQSTRESISAVENVSTEHGKEADNTPTNPNHQPSGNLISEHQHIVEGGYHSHAEQHFAGSDWDSGYASASDSVAEQPDQDMYSDSGYATSLDSLAVQPDQDMYYSDSADHGRSHTEQRDPSTPAGQEVYEGKEAPDDNHEVGNRDADESGSGTGNRNGTGDGDGGDDDKGKDKDKDYDADDEDQDQDSDSDSDPDSEADSRDDDEDCDNLGQDYLEMLLRQGQGQIQRQEEGEQEAEDEPVQYYRYVHTDQHGRRLAWDYTNIPTRFDRSDDDGSTPPPRSSTSWQVVVRQFRRAARRVRREQRRELQEE
ncbi:hypothetical protein LTR67_007583 [Exophiala xenobiotica]